jgi:MtN3 and saliva related transmembrane protein
MDMPTQPGPGGNPKTDSTPEMNGWTRPAAMAIPKEGFFKKEDGRYGPIFHELRNCGAGMGRYKSLCHAVLFLSLITLCGCQDLVPRDTQSLFIPEFQRSEIFGFLAGLGTTFAAVPDLVAMLRRRSSVGMNPRMAAIMGVFQILWVYYGLLIASRPVILWNVIAVLVNSLSVGAYLHFVRKGEKRATT